MPYRHTHTHTPAELLDRAHVDDPVVEMVHELRHVLVQELLVSMHRVPCREKERISHSVLDVPKVLQCFLSKKNVYFPLSGIGGPLHGKR